MVPPSMPAGHPEPVIIDRITRSNRHLWYRLEVIQQPERARACGAGPKSSADRRPVDPPPVVELRIYEGPSLDRAKDITFTYNANFFLFATLEHARAMVRGRLQSPSTATPPVLTGMPVSGMAYLDRPLEAGYFLFPDLSVRHEGRYRLSFNLYEQTKETGDLDQPTEQGKAAAEMPESFDWRMEVKSNPFMVFSAKKFPGLTESTALSRTVAEQGCRVRIRRDVRMRRREGKSAAVSAAAVASSANGDDEYARHRTQTPDAAAAAAANYHRARSISQESMNRIPYGPDPQRRPSRSSEYPSAPSPQHASAGPSMPPGFAGAGSQGPSSNNHLRFGAQQHSAYTPAPPIPASPTYTSLSHQQHQHQHQHAHQHPHAHSQSNSSFAAPPSQSYYQDRPASSQHYTTAPPSSSYSASSAGPGPSPRRDSFGAMDYHRRMSANYTTAPPPVLADDAITGRIEPARHIPPMVSPADSKQMTLPSVRELISFQGDGDSKPDLRRGSITMGNTSNGSHDKNGHNSSSDRVPSLSQLLLPPPGLPPRSQALNATKKRSYGQYNNTGYGHDDYDTAAVKNHARESESSPPVREYSELWWKRADGSVWTAQGEVSQSRA